MTAVSPGQRKLACTQCETVIEWCAVCEREECSKPVCYRCVRISCRQELRQPHGHGG